MTTLTVSGIGRRPDLDRLHPVAGLGVEPVPRPAGERHRGAREQVRPGRGAGAGEVELGHVVGGQSGRA